eukprot:1495503-Prymnesium_polylepis.1
MVEDPHASGHIDDNVDVAAGCPARSGRDGRDDRGQIRRFEWLADRKCRRAQVRPEDDGLDPLAMHQVAAVQWREDGPIVGSLGGDRNA